MLGMIRTAKVQSRSKGSLKCMSNRLEISDLSQTLYLRESYDKIDQN